MFRRPTIRYGQTPEPTTPYQRAAQAWDDRIGSARVQAKNWRLAFFGTLALSGGLAGGLVWQSARGHIVPWVVQVAVDVSSVIRASPDSFRVAWTERRYQDGSLAATERWSAILTIVVQPPRTPDALRKNPLGVFVNALNWSKELSQ